MENLPLRPKSAADVSSLQGAPDNVFQLVLRPRDAADVDRINTAIANRQQSQAYDQIVTVSTRRALHSKVSIQSLTSLEPHEPEIKQQQNTTNKATTKGPA